jgi:hypothetical protein
VSIYLSDGVWVTVLQLEGPRAPRPLPLESGFEEGVQYKVLGVHSPSETSEAYFILCNDRDEVWFISNRHFRVADGMMFRRSPVPNRTTIPDMSGFSIR